MRHNGTQADRQTYCHKIYSARTYPSHGKKNNITLHYNQTIRALAIADDGQRRRITQAVADIVKLMRPLSPVVL